MQDGGNSEGISFLDNFVDDKLRKAFLPALVASYLPFYSLATLSCRCDFVRVVADAGS